MILLKFSCRFCGFTITRARAVIDLTQFIDTTLRFLLLTLVVYSFLDLIKSEKSYPIHNSFTLHITLSE